jgi:indole-3-glycerol phosphate synthase
MGRVYGGDRRVSILDEILVVKRAEVGALRRERRETSLLADARAAAPPRAFAKALGSGPTPRVVAEVKRASPSKGVLRADLDPAALAASYAAAGAVAISVLTDGSFFRGSLADLEAARAAVSLPVLRKDFVIDPLQLLEARAAGADAVLLIVAALEDPQIRELLALTREQGMEALVEVHTRGELERALAADASVVGINNRDLHTFRTDVDVTRRLLAYTGGRTVVSESGIEEAGTVRSLEALGVHAFLVGEALLRKPDPGKALRELREGA